jgi:hypothetical protein
MERENVPDEQHVNRQRHDKWNNVRNQLWQNCVQDTGRERNGV